MDQAEAKHLFEPTGDFQCLHEFMPAARAKLSDHIWGYLVGATETETTLRRNRLALDSLALRPRVCVDVSKVDLGTTLFGRKLRLPVILAPVGSLESFHPGGAATAGRAASAFGVPIMVSSVTHPGLEEAAAAATGPKIFQLYVRGDDAWVDDVVKRAVDAGYDAFAITVDTAAYSRRGGRKERLKAWRATAPLMAIAFEPARDPESGVDAPDVVQVHLEHRLVRRLLSRLLSQGFTSGLSRVCSIGARRAAARRADRPARALWARCRAPPRGTAHGDGSLDRTGPAHRPFGERGEEATLDQLEQALRENRTPSLRQSNACASQLSATPAIWSRKLRRRAETRRGEVARELVAVGEQEAEALRKLLVDQRERIAERDAAFDDRQITLTFDQAEAEQARRDRRRWQAKYQRLAREIIAEPERVRRSYDVVADRLEIVGLVHLWPKAIE